MNKFIKFGMATTLLAALSSATATTTYAAEGSYNVGNSTNAVLYVYTANTWSPAGYWDLRTSSIPVNATVTYVRESWDLCTSGCGQTSTGTHVYLFNGSGTYYPMDGYNGVTRSIFVGQSARQNWSTRFKVETQPFSNGAYIIPKFVIWWSDSTTLSSGMTNLYQDGSFDTELLPAGSTGSAARK